MEPPRLHYLTARAVRISEGSRVKVKQLVVTAPGAIELQEAELDERLEPHQALVRAEYSIVSAGTEGAGFTGLVREMPFGDAGRYPRTTGYGHLGEVLAVGSG